VTRIVGAGGYAPRYRVAAETVADAWGRFEAGGVASTAVPAADEDALTMAVAAGRRALRAADRDADSLAALSLATTTPPLAESDLTPTLGAALGLPEAAARRHHVGSARSGTEALLAAVDGTTPALVVAADCPRGEPSDARGHAAGAGAAALLLDAGEGGAAGEPSGRTSPGATVVDRATAGADYPGTRFREAGDERVRGLDVTAYDRAAVREAAAAAVGALDAAPDPDRIAPPAPDGAVPYRVADAVAPDAAVVAPARVLGDLGAAAPLLALVEALAAADPDERTLAVGHGAGGVADAVVVEGAAPVERSRGITVGAEGERADHEAADDDPEDDAAEGIVAVDYPTYLRLRGELSGRPPGGGGARISLPTWRRDPAARYRLVAGRCPDCGAVSFPGEGACGDCGALASFDPAPLARRGTVETATTVARGAPPEFLPQAERGGEYGVAVVRFSAADGDGAASVPLQVAGPDPDAVGAGDAVRATLRLAYVQDGVPRYGAKVVPTRGADGEG